MCACSRNSASATRNCARRWSIRRRRPRCSASSAARPPTCSRCSTPSSRAPRGFVGSMTWCCDSARGTVWFHGLILVPYPSPASRSVLMSHDFRWMREHGTLHIPDVREQNDFPTLGSTGGWRTFLAVPLRQQGELIGALNARRTEVRPFTPAQIKLLETFADQAVIAIENVRLFQELKESLEQQTATSEILGVIASSPTDIQPVLDAVAENAARLCEATDAQITRVDGDVLRIVASHGSIAVPSSARAEGIPIRRDIVAVERSSTVELFTLKTLAAEIDGEFAGAKYLQQITGQRATLSTPLLREGVAIGAIVIRRMEVRPFSEKQIKLLETFAAQAVIAIENVRLFKELRSAMRNCARRWSIRRRRPRCSASSAARRRTCSRCSTPSSRARRGFAGSMTWCCDSARATLWLHGLILAPYRSRASRSVLMSQQFRWMREHGTLHIPDVRAQNDFPTLGSVGAGAPSWPLPFVSRGNSLED